MTDHLAVIQESSLDIHEIMRMLMHRYPFLLVDGVTECAPGKHILGFKNVSRGETLCSKCVSGNWVMPRLLLIEALAQVSVILTYRTLQLDPTGRELMFFAGIDDARFMGDVRAGERLHLRSNVVRLRTKMGWFRAHASVGGRPIAEMSMLAAIQRR